MSTEPPSSLQAMAAAKLEALERRRLRRELVTTDRRDAVHARQGPQPLLSFSCNDYLGLTHHEEVIAAAVAATRRYGTGAGSARLVNGNHPLYAELERALAEIKGTEDAVVFGSGYLTNIGVIPALVGQADVVVLDELCHNSLLTGAELAHARILKFRHNDVAHAGELLKQYRREHRRALVVTDGVFSMEGDLAPLPALAELAAEHDAWLLSDDAHGLGVVGGGRGSTFAFTPAPRVPLQMGTLSKALGAYGGYLCTSRTVAELVRNRARSFVYSTGLPPGVVAAALKALEIIGRDSDLVRIPLERAALFCELLGLAKPQSPIVALVLGRAETALAASRALAAAGFLVTAIRPPTVPTGTSRLRFTFSAAHTQRQVRELATAVLALSRSK